MIRSTLFAVALTVLAPSLALAEPAKPETIEELLVVSKAQNLIESNFKNIEESAQANMNQALSQISVDTEERRAYVDSFSRKMGQILREELNWDVLKPIFVRIYSESFTQGEVVGVLDFYKTPAGQAMLYKMPLVLQKTMAEMQQHVGPLALKLGAARQATINEAEAHQSAKRDAAKPDEPKPAKKTGNQ